MAMMLLAGCDTAHGGTRDGSGPPRQSATASATESSAGPAVASSAEVAANVLTFTYRPKNDYNHIDQMLEINNSDTRSVVPVLAFTALDRQNRPLPDVRIRTVYGSDSGRLVATYGSSFDILRFTGTGRHQVHDVRVTVRHLATARERANIHPVTVQPLDDAGNAVSKFSRFVAVRVKNPDPFAVSVRVAYIVYDQPAKGETQQVVSATAVGGLVHVPAQGAVVLKVTGEAERAVARYSDGPAVSVKAYNSQ
ncbi:hypothetical protein [Streptomyces sp. R44]|uniref:Lipoprotein n=1 Tax=Streptomyces sp. R44 TaxID=3238633 RepID=A0AB39SZH1_9ACTN